MSTSKPLERKLAEFVDRTKEMDIFRDLLDPGESMVFMVWGEGGIGKTLLRNRMVAECSRRGLQTVEFVCQETRSDDYLAILRKIRDGLDPAPFNSFNDRLNYFTVPEYKMKLEFGGSVSVAGQAAISGTVGSMTGINVEEMKVIQPRIDLSIPEEDKRARLTDDFIEDFSQVLSASPSPGPLVIFLDAVEKLTDETKRWLWIELLGAVTARPLPNVRFVLCGRERAPEDLDKDLLRVLDTSELQPLQLEHILEYLEKRGVPEGSREDLALMIEGSFGGNPFQIASGLDSFFKLKKKRERRRE